MGRMARLLRRCVAGADSVLALVTAPCIESTIHKLMKSHAHDPRFAVAEGGDLQSATRATKSILITWLRCPVADGGGGDGGWLVGRQV